MNDRDAFLESIAKNPGDPNRRLYYADWLEDEGRDPAGGMFQRILVEPDRDDLRLAWAHLVGGERGEFVKVQCELAAWEAGYCTAACHHADSTVHRDTCRWAALRKRERELLAAHFSDWLPSLGLIWGYVHPDSCDGWTGPANRKVLNCRFTRGFVSQITLSWADWLTRHKDLLAACPLTGRDSLVRLTTPPVGYIRWQSTYEFSDGVSVSFDKVREAEALGYEGILAAMWARWEGVRFDLLTADDRRVADDRLAAMAFSVGSRRP